jgi:phosphoribosylglycinamide formyltransferase-1
VDSGPIIAQERIPVHDGDDEARLHERIKPVERRLLIQAILDIANSRIDLKELR